MNPVHACTLDPSKLERQLQGLVNEFAKIPLSRSVASLVRQLYSKNCKSNLLLKIEAVSAEAATAEWQALLVKARQFYAGLMQRYAREIAKPLGGVWQFYDELAAQRAQLKTLDSERAVTSIVELKQRSLVLAQSIDELLPFCLENQDSGHPSEFFPAALRNNVSLPRLCMKLVTGVDKLLRRVPNAAFNALLPPCLPLPTAPCLRRLPPPECLICGEANTLQVQFCSDTTCCANTICYACLRASAWAVQHDRERVFSQLRPLPCPFCRRALDLQTLQPRAVLFTGKAKRSANPHSRAAKRVRV